ncbi:TIGR03087 family PEP-CTERM/XrtA system glycosyltransferase [Alteriqipengyuania lutimaris]|uniref:TIGR03087 family PEP-CTERM/XrtA system glycosyltransferase n=1 Tax=Alteriqipengyuania lutimaris TaxID=1538146 RepID=A0A395LNY8_9SPHN|nr:TIGR03087 family PEP-CTERM/XrtA system glycosyltransferase [Alteriqipengyuania lutimaris]MBB3032759.1 sugar transferase (PEP-CTERM/EpsH1 system associated) [Alteriqipengyuania lutimaris]RDS78137.1 TIGR03087 family PEP-CTERM/XrtA system glycosyltransferase [Alteriqipengyuania lutimaris]
MGETLFLAHRVPFPPDRGDKIRSYHVLRALAALGKVHVGTFDDNSGYGDQFLGGIAASHFLVPHRKSDVLAAAEAMVRGQPVSLTAFAHDGLRDWVEQVLHYRPIDAIYVFSGQMAQYVPPHFPGRTVLDLCDVDSAKFEAYGKAGHGPKAWVNAREGRKLASAEERFARAADTTLLISENEANLFRTRVTSMNQIDLRVMRNGIDAQFFAPESLKPQPTLYGQGPNFVFTGQMDYAPNVEAVERMVHRILPGIRDIHARAEFHIVGRAPTAAVKALGRHDGVTVWGEVPDVRPYLMQADIVTAPLTIARGIQNKVLEAMAMAKPVLLSPEAATGIDGDDGVHFAVAEGDRMMIGRALALCDDRAKRRAMGEAARRFVEAEQSWPAMLAGLGELLRPLAAGSVRDAA